MDSTEGMPYYINCSKLTISQFQGMIISRGVSAVICGLVMATIFIILWRTKAYTSFIQRMFLYLMVATILHEVCQAANLGNLFIDPLEKEPFCSVLGFLTNWLGSIVIISSFSIIFSIILLALLSLRGANMLTLGPPTHFKALVDIIYLTFVILFPFSFLWVPLNHGNYGISVAWCWIITYNETCDYVGFTDQMIAGYGMYIFVGVSGTIAMVSVTIVYYRLHKCNRYTMVQRLLLQSLALATFVLLFILVIFTCLAMRIHYKVTDKSQHYVMWMFYGAAIPFCHLFIPIGFFCSFYFKHIWSRMCGRARNRETNNKTVPPSDRISAPSSTFFNISFTKSSTTRDGEDTQLLPSTEKKDKSKRHVSFV